MASRWRIRHKLLLGLGLVVLIMALLLGGTLRGLWSYYLTTNSIRARLNQLYAGEKLKTAVTELLASKNIADLILNNPNRLNEEIHRVQQALTLFSDTLEENQGQSRDPYDSVYQKEQVNKIKEDLEALPRAIRAYMARASVQSRALTPDQIIQDLENHSQPMQALRQDTHDLLDSIKDDLGDRLSETRNHYQGALSIIVPASIIGLLVLVGLMRSFYTWVFTPIHDLYEGVGRVAQGELTHRIDLHSGDEMEELAQAFNTMLARLNELYNDLARQVNERSRQLVRSERLASVGFLAAGVAHEINNPLASIAFCSEALEARLEGLLGNLRLSGQAAEEHETFARYLRMIQEEAFRCKNITERLLEFSRTGEPRREVTDLRQLVEAVLNLTQHLPNHKGKHITFEVPNNRDGGRVYALVNAEEIKSVILNLVINALESMEEGGQLTIRLGMREGIAELRFTDTGCGMTQEVLDNIFEPFYTRSRSGKGTGLGLTISHLIISQHGGEIEASSAGPGQGSQFVVRLPVQVNQSAGELPSLGTVPKETVSRAA